MCTAGPIGGGGVAAAKPMVVPQFPQNAAPGAMGEPQFGHTWTFVMVTDAKETSCAASAVPQFLQKVDPSRFTVPHRGQVAMGGLVVSTSP